MSEIKQETQFTQTSQGSVKMTIVESFKTHLNYGFNVGIAQKYGIEEAIMINNLIFWTETNKANNHNFYDGYFWTFNSVKAYQDIFPFWSIGQIRRILDSLEKKGVIKSGNYNKLKYDHTKWYAVIDESICRNQQINLTDSANQFVETNKPIPVINTDINTDINSYKESASAPTSKYKQMQKIFDESIKKNYGLTQDQINKTIWLIPKQRSQFKILIADLTEDQFIRLMNTAESDKWIKDKGMAPSLLNSQKSNLLLKSNSSDNKYDADGLYKYNPEEKF